MAKSLHYESRGEWLDLRNRGVGGSEAGAVMGLNPYKTPLDVYLEKRGEVEPDDLSDNPAVQWGIKLEDLIAREYAERTGRKVRRVNRILQHPEHAYMLASLDRSVAGEDRILECKTAGAFMTDQWGEPGTDEVPMTYLIQCMHYLAVDGAAICDLAVLIGGRDFRIYTIRRDEELIETLIKREGEFWRMVLDGTPPPPMTEADFDKLYPNGDTGESAQADVETASRCAALADIKAELRALADSKKALEMEIKKAMGDAAVLERDGATLATWKTQERKGYTVKPSRPRVFLLK